MATSCFALFLLSMIRTFSKWVLWEKVIEGVLSLMGRKDQPKTLGECPGKQAPPSWAGRRKRRQSQQHRSRDKSPRESSRKGRSKNSDQMIEGTPPSTGPTSRDCTCLQGWAPDLETVGDVEKSLPVIMRHASTGWADELQLHHTGVLAWVREKAGGENAI